MLSCAWKHSGLLLGRCIISKHKVVCAENTTAALDLRLLNFYSFLVLLIKVVLPRWVWANWLPVLLSLLAHPLTLWSGLPRAYDLDTAGNSLGSSYATTSLASGWALTSTHCPLLFLRSDKSTSHASGADLARALLLIATLPHCGTCRGILLLLVGVDFREGAEWAGLLLLWVLRVRTEHAVKILRCSAWTSALWSLNHALFIGELAPAARLLSVSCSASGLWEKFVALLEAVWADRLRIWEVVFLGAVLLCLIFYRSIISDIEHIFHMLRLVLRGAVVELLFVGQLNRARSIEKLRGTVGWHVLLEFVLVKPLLIGICTTAYTTRARTWLQYAVSKDLAVEESQVVWTGSVKALIGVRIRWKLVYNVLSVLWTSKELICASLTSGELLGSGQIIDELAPAAWAFMTLLQLFLDHIFCLVSASKTITGQGLRSTNLPSTVQLLLLTIVSTLLSLLLLLLLIHFGKVFLVSQRIWTELLSLLARSLLIGHLLLPQLEIVGSTACSHIHPLHTRIIHVMATSLVGRHMENGRSLARVIDNNVVDVVIIDDVRDVATSWWVLCLNTLLWVTWRWSSAAHPESLTIRVSCALKSALILTLLSHWVFSEFLRTSERSLLIISIAIDEVVIFLIVLLISARGLCVIWTENTSLAVSHVTLSGQFTLTLWMCIIFKVTFRDFHIGFLRGFNFCNNWVRLIPQVILVATESVSFAILLLLVEEIIGRALSLLWLMMSLRRFRILVLAVLRRSDRALLLVDT